MYYSIKKILKENIKTSSSVHHYKIPAFPSVKCQNSNVASHETSFTR